MDMSFSRCDWTDSPLSTTVNVVGILTFLVAVAASALAYWNIVRSAEQERDGAMNELRTWLDRIDRISNHSGHLEEGEREARERRDRVLRTAWDLAVSVSKLIMQSLHVSKSNVSIATSGALLEPVQFFAGWLLSRYLSMLGWLRVRKEVMEQMSRFRAMESDLVLETMAGLGRYVQASTRSLFMTPLADDLKAKCCVGNGD